MKSLTPSEKYEALNALISDKELKFGCEVLMQGTAATIFRASGRGYFLCGGGSRFYKYHFNKILGTPPDLSRVLWWMQKQGIFLKMWHMVEDLSLFFEKSKSEGFEWDLSKPLLRDQSPEVWEFLYDLLIQK